MVETAHPLVQRLDAPVSRACSPLFFKRLDALEFKGLFLSQRYRNNRILPTARDAGPPAMSCHLPWRRLPKGASRDPFPISPARNPALAFAQMAAKAYPRHPYFNRANPGHDRSLGQMAVAHQPLPAIGRALVGMRGQKIGHLSFHRVGEQRSCPLRAKPRSVDL